MGTSDRFNRMLSTMVRLAEEGQNPILAVRYQGQVQEFNVNPVTHHLESTASQHPRAILEDRDTQFIEGYPSRSVDRTLSEIW